MKTTRREFLTLAAGTASAALLPIPSFGQGANPRVVLRAVRDFWLLRLRMWATRTRALRRGPPMLGTDVGHWDVTDFTEVLRVAAGTPGRRAPPKSTPAVKQDTSSEKQTIRDSTLRRP